MCESHVPGKIWHSAWPLYMICIFKCSRFIVFSNHWIAKHKLMHRRNNHPLWRSQSIDHISIFDLFVHANQSSPGKPRQFCRMSVRIQHHHVWTLSISVYHLEWSGPPKSHKNLIFPGHYQHLPSPTFGPPSPTGCSKWQQSHCGTPLLMLLANVYGLSVAQGKRIYQPSRQSFNGTVCCPNIQLSNGSQCGQWSVKVPQQPLFTGHFQVSIGTHSFDQCPNSTRLPQHSKVKAHNIQKLFFTTWNEGTILSLPSIQVEKPNQKTTWHLLNAHFHTHSTPWPW